MAPDTQFTTVSPGLFGKPRNASCWARVADLDNVVPTDGNTWEHVAGGDANDVVPQPFSPRKGEVAGKTLSAPGPDGAEQDGGW